MGMAKKMKLFSRLMVVFSTIWAMCLTPIQAVEAKAKDPIFIELNLSDGNPLETLKQKVIEYRASKGLLDLDSIDIEDSSITVDNLDLKNKLRQINVTVYLCFSEGKQDSAIGYSFQESVMVDLISTDKPQILLKNDEITIRKDTEFNAMEYVAYCYDDDTTYPTIITNTDLDTSTPGTYKVTYSVIDKAGNKTSTDLKVIVGRYSGNVRMVSMAEAQINDDGSIQAMLSAINAIRNANGIHSLNMADGLGLTAAAMRAEEASYYLSHNRPDGTYFITALDEVGVSYSVFPNEVLVAMGNSVEANLGWWMSSAGHSARLMNPAFSTIALGQYGGVWVGILY